MVTTTNATRTIEDLLSDLFYARNAVASAEMMRNRVELELMHAMSLEEVTQLQSDNLHISVSLATRRTAKVIDEQHLAGALNKIGQVIPRKESIDTTKLLAIADMYGGDFPGVEVRETEYLTVRGRS